MKIHETNISKSIELNIIGTANIVRACKMLGIKLIYFSTSYIYPGKKGKLQRNRSFTSFKQLCMVKIRR